MYSDSVRSVFTRILSVKLARANSLITKTESFVFTLLPMRPGVRMEIPRKFKSQKKLEDQII